MSVSVQFVKAVKMESNEENNQSSSDDLVYDTSKLLQLLESISSVTDSTVLQSMINIYLKQLLDTPYVLMVPLLPQSEEGLIQVMNDQILEKEFRFSVSSSMKSNTAKKKKCTLASHSQKKVAN